jgi:hypothetical protein
VIQFKDLTEISATHWKAPETFGFLGEFPHVPLSDTELLLSAHHLPIAILDAGSAPEVVAVLDPGLQRTRLLDARGRWLRGYLPIALRSLPFRLEDRPGPEPRLQAAPDLKLMGTEGHAILRPDGRPTRELKAVETLLATLQAGRQRLTAAAERLILADLLAPIRRPGGGPILPPLLTVEQRQVERLTGRRAAALLHDSILELDLGMACLFSQRHFSDAVTWTPEPSAPDDLSRPDVEVLIRGMEHLPVALDSSELFSIDLLESE